MKHPNIGPARPSRDRATLAQIAMDIFDGKVFGTWLLKDTDEFAQVFPITIFLEQLPEGTVHLFEYRDKAGPMAINGMPMFFSCQLLNADEWAQLAEMHKALQVQRDEFKRQMEGEEE